MSINYMTLTYINIIHQTLTCENLDLKVSEMINMKGNISRNLPNGLLGVNVYKTFDSYLYALLRRFQ